MTTTIREETKKISLLLENMLNLVIENHQLASKAIKKNDKKLAIKILEKDKTVDLEFFSIQSDLEFMIAKAPVDKNLRRVLAFLHIIINIEKIGDFAKKIAKFIIKNEEISNSSIKRITKSQDKFILLLKQVPKIIVNENVKLARKTWKTIPEVYKIINEVRKEVVSSISNKSNKKAIEERLFILNIVNSFDRASSHIGNICELLQYIETGQHLNLHD